MAYGNIYYGQCYRSLNSCGITFVIAGYVVSYPTRSLLLETEIRLKGAKLSQVDGHEYDRAAIYYANYGLS